MLEAGAELLKTLLTGVKAAIPKVLEVAKTLIQTVTKALTDNLPELVVLAAEILDVLILGLIDMLPELVGVAVQLVDICEKFSGTGIYCVTLPLQIMLADVSTPGAPAVVGVPAVKLSQEPNDTEQGMLTLGGNTEYLSRDYQYTRGGYFLRKSPYIATSSTLTVTYTQHYAAGTPKHWALIGEAGITAVATGATFPSGIVAADGVEPVSNAVSLSIGLSGQTQDIELYTIRQTNVQRECKIVIPVYRKG